MRDEMKMLDRRVEHYVDLYTKVVRHLDEQTERLQALERYLGVKYHPATFQEAGYEKTVDNS